MPIAEPRRSQALLAAWAVTAFALSALTDPLALAGAGAAALVLFRRGAVGALRRVATLVLPVTAGLSATSFLVLWIAGPERPSAAPFLSLAGRAALVAFVAFSVLDRVRLLVALGPFPDLARLAALTLAQIHALRLLANESALGLRSRLPRRPGTLDVARNAGAVTATLLALSARNARDIGDAMRSRGFR